MGKRHMPGCLHRAVEYLSSPHGDGKLPFTDKVGNLPHCALARKSRT